MVWCCLELPVPVDEAEACFRYYRLWIMIRYIYISPVQ